MLIYDSLAFACFRVLGVVASGFWVCVVLWCGSGCFSLFGLVDLVDCGCVVVCCLYCGGLRCFWLIGSSVWLSCVLGGLLFDWIVG